MYDGCVYLCDGCVYLCDVCVYLYDGVHLRHGCVYLFEAVHGILGGCRGDNGPVAPWAELQCECQSRYQLQTQIGDAHFIIQHPDGPLPQHRVRQG